MCTLINTTQKYRDTQTSTMHAGQLGLGARDTADPVGDGEPCTKQSVEYLYSPHRKFKRGGSRGVRSWVGGSKVRWVGLIPNTPHPSYKPGLLMGKAYA